MISDVREHFEDFVAYSARVDIEFIRYPWYVDWCILIDVLLYHMNTEQVITLKKIKFLINNIT